MKKIKLNSIIIPLLSLSMIIKPNQIKNENNILYDEISITNFDSEEFRRKYGYVTVSKIEENQKTTTKTEWTDYYLFSTNITRQMEISSVFAYHQEGKDEVEIKSGVSKITEKEITESLGVENKIKIGVVITYLNCGWTMGITESQSQQYYSSSNILLDQPTGVYYKKNYCTIRTYFLLTRYIKKIDYRSKSGTVTSSQIIVSVGNETGFFENFDFLSPIEIKFDIRS